MNKRLEMILVLVVLLAAYNVPAKESGCGTFSIVAWDSVTQELGVAVQSKAFSVGSVVAWAEAGVGAIATQAMTNKSFGPRGLELLRTGMTSDEVLKALLESDPGKEDRQVGIVDAQGRAVNFTGSRCLEWAGGIVGRGYACQGNILASEEVVKSMAKAFEETQGELADKLLAALVAGQEAGGDKRGMQSAALLVVRPSEIYPEYRYRYIDLRVEDHLDPINELIRLYNIHKKSDLLQAHIRFVAYYDSIGNSELAARERGLVGNMMKQALSERIDDADYLNNLAWFCATANMFLEDCLEAARRAVELKPDAAYILDTLAEVYFRLGRVEEAISTEERACELDPESTYYKEQIEKFKAKK